MSKQFSNRVSLSPTLTRKLPGTSWITGKLYYFVRPTYMVLRWITGHPERRVTLLTGVSSFGLCRKLQGPQLRECGYLFSHAGRRAQVGQSLSLADCVARVYPYTCPSLPSVALCLGWTSQMAGTVLDVTLRLDQPQRQKKELYEKNIIFPRHPSDLLPRLCIQTSALPSPLWPQEENGHSCLNPGSGDKPLTSQSRTFRRTKPGGKGRARMLRGNQQCLYWQGREISCSHLI